MKRLFVLTVLTAVCTAFLTTGCKTPTTKPVKPTAVPTLKPTAEAAADLEFADEIYATVTADQLFEMDGKLYKVSEIPAVLKQKKVSEYITIVVAPESKMTRETLGHLLQTLVDHDYLVVVGEESKYADTVVPKKQKA